MRNGKEPMYPVPKEGHEIYLIGCDQLSENTRPEKYQSSFHLINVSIILESPVSAMCVSLCEMCFLL
jgi:hypothetical protein